MKTIVSLHILPRLRDNNRGEQRTWVGIIVKAFAVSVWPAQ
jgi:hypothetical protein